MSVMYSLPQIVPSNMVLDLPTSMYRLPKIQVTENFGNETSSNVDLASLEARQESILRRLEDLKIQVETLTGSKVSKTPAITRKMDVVVRADPAFPPRSLPLICSQLQKSGLVIFTSSHVHSSLVKPLPQNLLDFLPAGCENRAEAQICVTLIWKPVGRDPECIESALAHGVIRGEANLLRFFCRQFNLIGYVENSTNITESTKIDAQLDAIHSELFWGDEKVFSKKLEEALKKEEFLGGQGKPNVADFLAFSALDGKKQTPSLQNWVKKCKAAFA